MVYFSEVHFFNKKDVLYLENVPSGEPMMSGKLVLFPEIIHKLTTGEVPPPKLSTQFPAEKLETQLEWDDLILSEKTLQQIKELETWLQHNDHLFKNWGMEKRLKAGYRVLFHGPAGTGKTLTASLLGKYTHKPVYRIDLSTVVSKYIGETEKTFQIFLIRPPIKTGFCFLMRPMLSSENEQMLEMPTINMQTKRLAIYCNVWNRIPD